MDGNLYGTAHDGGFYGFGVVFELRKSKKGWIERVLHSFCSDYAACTDGGNPSAGLTYAGQSTGAPWDEASPLFGTTFYGGQYQKGVVFELTNNGSTFGEAVIHNFQTSSDPGALAIDSAGNLYGATRDGGQYNGGLFFKLAHGTWTETILHKFCAQTNCADGSGDVQTPARPVIDANGNIFSVTEGGGAGDGVVFELKKGNSGYSYHVISTFCSTGTCNDGRGPVGLTMNSSGTLFGATGSGGKNPGGVVFKLHNSSGGWTESVLHNFCKQSLCADGSRPVSAVILDGNGDLFGTTEAGGKHGDYGTVFELTP